MRLFLKNEGAQNQPDHKCGRRPLTSFFALIGQLLFKIVFLLLGLKGQKALLVFEGQVFIF